MKIVKIVFSVKPRAHAFGVKVPEDAFPIVGALFVAETEYYTKPPALTPASKNRNALYVFPAQCAAGVVLSHMTTTLTVPRVHQQVQGLRLYAIQQVGSTERAQLLVQ